MPPLDASDREYFDRKFLAMSDHIVELQRDMAVTRTEMMGHFMAVSCKQVKAHEQECHDPRKTWGLIGAIIAATAGGLEFLRRLI